MPRSTLARLLCGLVARLGTLVHGVEAGKLLAALDLADDPGLHPLVLGAVLGHEGHEILRDHHCPIVIAHDDITGEYCAAAASNRLLPADESERIDGCR